MTHASIRNFNYFFIYPYSLLLCDEKQWVHFVWMTTMGLSRCKTHTVTVFARCTNEPNVCRFAIFRKKCAFILYILIKTWLGDYGCWYNIRSHLARRIVNGYTPMPNIPKNSIASVSSDSHMWRGARARSLCVCNVETCQLAKERWLGLSSCARSTRVRWVFVTRQIKLFQYFNWELHLSNRYNDGAPSWVIIIWRTEQEGRESSFST